MKVYARAVRRRERLAGDYLVAFDAALRWTAHGMIGAKGTGRKMAKPNAPHRNGAAKIEETAS